MSPRTAAQDARIDRTASVRAVLPIALRRRDRARLDRRLTWAVFAPK